MPTNCIPSSPVNSTATTQALEEYKQAKIQAAKGQVSFIQKLVEAHAGNGSYLQLLALSASGLNKDVDAYLRDKGLLTQEALPEEVTDAARAPYIEEMKAGNRFDLYDAEIASGMVLAGAPVTMARMVKVTAAKESGKGDPPFEYAHKIHMGKDKNGNPVKGGYGLMAIVPGYHGGNTNPITNPKQYSKEVLLVSIPANVEVGTRFLKYLLRQAGGDIGLAFEFYGPNAPIARRTRKHGISTNAMNGVYEIIYGIRGPW